MLKELKPAEAYKLINHGPTTIVAASYLGVRSAKTVDWVMPINVNPPQIAVVLGASFTTELICGSGEFTLNVPASSQRELAYQLGTSSGREQDKFKRFHIPTSPACSVSAPLIDGCVAHLECKLEPNEAIQLSHDLYVADVVAAWADDQVFVDGEYRFPSAEMSTFHHTARGRFRLTGQPIPLPN